MLVDSHCHLDHSKMEVSPEEAVRRARLAGVERIVTICTRLDRYELVSGIAEGFDDVFMGVGVHPHEAGEAGIDSPDRLIELAADPKMVGVGETGLDYFYDFAPKQRQRTSFEAHILAARHLALPLIIHTRDADDDTVSILREHWQDGPFLILIHCFTGGQALADAVVEMDGFVSLSGITTFKSAEDLRQVIDTVPNNRLIVETDAPYLAPTPHRGKTNEPAFVAHTADFWAARKGMEAADFRSVTGQNFLTLFSKVPGERVFDDR